MGQRCMRIPNAPRSVDIPRAKCRGRCFNGHDGSCRTLICLVGQGEVEQLKSNKGASNPCVEARSRNILVSGTFSRSYFRREGQVGKVSYSCSIAHDPATSANPNTAKHHIGDLD